MKAQRYSTLHVLATGVLALLVTLVVLFWARWGCESARYSLLPKHVQQVEIDAPDLIKPKGGGDPNAVILLRFIAMMSPGEVPAAGLGIAQYRESLRLDDPGSLMLIRSVDDQDSRLYYDRSLRTIVYHHVVPLPQPDGKVRMEKAVAYAGPEGIADKPDKKLGRFRDPVVRLIAGNLDRPIVYDRGLRRFFAIDWRGKMVRQGPALTGKGTSPVVDFGWPRKQPACLSLNLDTPEPHYTYGRNPDRAVVLDAAGAIHMLDLDTLEYTRSVGALPAPATLFASSRRATPNSLFAFDVLPVFVGKGDIYAGCAVAALSRDATAMRLEVFDANGASVAREESAVRDNPMVSSRGARYNAPSTVLAVYFELPGAAALTATEFVLESLHPPMLLWLSYFTAQSVEATAGHRSLFVLPNSFAAMKGRDAESWWLPRFVGAVPFLLPGVVVGVVLSRLVGAHARRTGMARRARRLWIVATVLFGLPAYVTYQITRPTTARVTCLNCGRDRWVDGEKCHHCGSPWLVPELVPPAWRVIGQPEDQACNDPAPRPEETISREFEV